MAEPTYKLAKPALEFVTLECIRQTHEAIGPYIVRTPVLLNDLFSEEVSRAVGHKVTLYFKAEPLQKTGSFKVRGALNAVMAAQANHANLPGIITYSSGNHGAGAAYAAMRLGVKAAITVPGISPRAKIANMERYGAEIIQVEKRPDDVKATCEGVASERGYALVHPYNQREIMVGQATCAVEFVEDVPQMEALLAPVSGGGLISGLAIGCKHMNPNIKIFGVAPTPKRLGEALAHGIVPDHWSPYKFIDTKCDALIAHPLNVTFPVMFELLEKQTFDVTDAEAAAAMKIAWQRLKLTIELNSATAIAALSSEAFLQTVRQLKLSHIGIVLSGGNADLDGPMPWTCI